MEANSYHRFWSDPFQSGTESSVQTHIVYIVILMV